MHKNVFSLYKGISSLLQTISTTIPMIPSSMKFGESASYLRCRFRTLAAIAPQTQAPKPNVQQQQQHPLPKLTPDSSVVDAIKIACTALGRVISSDQEREISKKLTDNWFSSARDLAAMTDAQASSLGVPLRLKSFIAEELSQEEGEVLPFDVDKEDEEEEEEEGDTKIDDNKAAVLGFQEQADWQALPIEQRICPPLKRFGNSYIGRPNVTTRTKNRNYRLSSKELTPLLLSEFEALKKFGTKKFFGAQAEPIAEVTAQKYEDHVRGMLGWMHTVQGVPLHELSLKLLVPSAERAAVAPTFDYCQWLVTERNINVRTELMVMRSILYVAKFLYHDLSEVRPNSSSEKPYSDLNVVKELRNLISTNNKASKNAPRVADEGMKWLDWNDYLVVCQELKKECALLSSSSGGNKERPRKHVAWSLQRYLIFSILASVPDRQRTLRELEIGRTLIKEGDKWVIRHGPKDYKTGKSYGERPPLLLSPSMYPELEAFIATWRAELEPQHNFLFTQENKQPFSDSQLSKFFMVTAYRLTGQRLTPHLVRDSIVTFLRRGNATERELESLALYMGHSIEMQRSSYDRRTKDEKVGPAVALLEAMNDDFLAKT